MQITPIPLRRTAGTVDLVAVARRLSLDHHTPRVIIAKLRSLHQHSGFPLPRNPRIVGGVPRTGADVICKASVWDRWDLDQWFDDREPPAAAALCREQQRKTTRHDLAVRAAQIAGQGVAA